LSVWSGDIPGPDNESIANKRFAGCAGVTIFFVLVIVTIEKDMHLLTTIFETEEGDTIVTPSIPFEGISSSADAIRIC